MFLIADTLRNDYISFYVFIQWFFKIIFFPNPIIIVYGFLLFSCLCKTFVFSSVIFTTGTLFILHFTVTAFTWGGRWKGGVSMLFRFGFFSSVYLGCVNSWFAKRLWKICLMQRARSSPLFCKSENSQVFLFSCAVCVAFWEQKLEGENSPHLRVTTTSELCKTHSSSAELVGVWYPAQALLSFATRRVTGCSCSCVCLSMALVPATNNTEETFFILCSGTETSSKIITTSAAITCQW